MCLLAFGHREFPGYDLIFVANRDERFSRPTAPADFWKDAPAVLAGRDLAAGGTWMGVTRGGRFAFLTNYRDPSRYDPGARSRGSLVGDFLRGGASPREYLEKVASESSRYNGFNLIVGSRAEVFSFSSRAPRIWELAPGLYGLSNHLLETPWPKVRKAKEGLRAAMTGARELPSERLFALFRDPEPAPDAELPETGVGLARERALSAAFITLPGYGTRCTTLLALEPDGRAMFLERNYSEDRGVAPTTVEKRFKIEGSSS